jgi:hypothetical protein
VERFATEFGSMFCASILRYDGVELGEFAGCVLGCIKGQGGNLLWAKNRRKGLTETAEGLGCPEVADWDVDVPGKLLWLDLSGHSASGLV